MFVIKASVKYLFCMKQSNMQKHMTRHTNNLISTIISYKNYAILRQIFMRKKTESAIICSSTFTLNDSYY
jgi:hypothetical protein